MDGRDSPTRAMPTGLGPVTVTPVRTTRAASDTRTPTSEASATVVSSTLPAPSPVTWIPVAPPMTAAPVIRGAPRPVNAIPTWEPEMPAPRTRGAASSSTRTPTCAPVIVTSSARPAPDSIQQSPQPAVSSTVMPRRVGVSEPATTTPPPGVPLTSTSVSSRRVPEASRGPEDGLRTIP